MLLIRDLENLKNQINPCVITIGNFDGLHLGHIKLLDQLKKKAKEYGVPSVVMTFEPQPNEYFSENSPTPRLMRFREKFETLATLGIDVLICVRFDRSFAALSAEKFVMDFLVSQLGIEAIILGDDFRFGQKRMGDIKMLQTFGQQYHFDVVVLPTVSEQHERVSSTRIRNALWRGDLHEAHDLLGHNYFTLGKVVHGDKLGRRLGCPTANVYMHRRSVPLMGIFVVRVYGITAKPLDGVASIGIRPTFNKTRVILEVHLFNFDRDIYGKNIRVEFLHKLRDEERYDSIDALIVQIQKDMAAARAYFQMHDQ